MTTQGIVTSEGESVSVVSESIRSGLKKLRTYFDKNGGNLKNEHIGKGESRAGKGTALENRQKILLNKKTDAERRARTRRLIEHEAILESIFPALAGLSGEEIKTFLLSLSCLPEAREAAEKAAKSANTG